MLNQQPYSPQDYLQSFCAGEERGFSYFFKLYYRPLCFYAGRFVTDTAVAEDVVTDTFIRIWEKKPLFENASALKSWLYTAVRNAAISWLRKNNTGKKLKQEITHHTDNTDLPVLYYMVHTEFILQLHAAIQTLPPVCRTIFNKVYIEGISTNELATELNLSATTIRTQKHRGILLLRKRLSIVSSGK